VAKVKCPDCHGKGEPCAECGGDGKFHGDKQPDYFTDNLR
jgi:DnaJ-class molecular chaperone